MSTGLHATVSPETLSLPEASPSERPASTERRSIGRDLARRLRTIRGYAVTTVREPRLLFSPKQYIFLLSHMRCYSSVLAHILGNHRDILGSSEVHQPYRGRRDLLRLRYMTYWSHRKGFDARYILDKILHNHLDISPRILSREWVKPVFILRRPEETIPSIIRMETYLDGQHRADGLDSPEKVVDYYVERLLYLERLCLSLKRPGLYFDAERLIHDTSRLFAFLERELKLNSPLSEDYATYEHTGRAGPGDMSPQIKTGRLVRERSAAPALDIDPAILARAQAAYDHCRTLLRKHCLCE